MPTLHLHQTTDNDPAILLNKAIMFIIQGRNQETIEFYDKVLAIEPNDV
jgi:hypothetical protein